jgi:hypothetical protein
MDLDNKPLSVLGHRIGLHVDVDLQGKTVGGVGFDEQQWVSGVIIGLSETGTYLTVQLDEPIGGGESHGLLGRPSKGQDRVSIDDPAHIRAKQLSEVMPAGVPPQIVELARNGKTLKAIKEYRALTGATLDEAKAWLRTL